VTIDETGLMAVSPATHSADKSYSVDAPGIRRLTLTTVNGKSRIWFAFKTGEHYQISFYDPENKATRIDIPGATVNSEPYSLAASKDGKTIWLVTLSGDLWKISNADGGKADMALESVSAFGREARQIMCDHHGYLWVTLPSGHGYPNSALAECLPDGQVKGAYDLKMTVDAYDIAYVNTATTPDTFYLADFRLLGHNKGTACLRPADWIDPSVVNNLSLTDPSSIDVEHDKEFPVWTVTVKENHGDLKHDVQMDLLVSDPVNGAFEILKGDKSHLSPVCLASAKVVNKGVVNIDTLYAKGVNGSTFYVYARIRGLLSTPQLVAQAGIFAPVTKITPSVLNPVNVHTTKRLSIPLGVNITTVPDSMQKRSVRFTSKSSSVKLGKDLAMMMTEYTDDKGYAGVDVTAGSASVANTTVEAICGAQKAAFTINVLPLPTSLQLPSPKDWKGKAGFVATAAFTITLNDALDGEAVELVFLNYGSEKDVYVKKMSDGTTVAEKDLATLFITDKNGKIILGNEHSYGIYCNAHITTITVTANYRYEDGIYSQTQRYDVSD
jgi:hypothetical protein